MATSRQEEGDPEWMLEWPATPGRERYRAARDIIEQCDPRLANVIDTSAEGPEEREKILQAIDDMRTVQELENVQDYRLWATRTFLQQAGLSPGREYLGILLQIALQGCSRTFVGMAAASTQGAAPGNMTYGFTRLHRDPEWMGLDLLLENCGGLAVLVYQDPEQPGEPGAVVAVPPELIPRDDPAAGPMPAGGTAAVLSNIVRWHGAASCRWITES